MQIVSCIICCTVSAVSLLHQWVGHHREGQTKNKWWEPQHADPYCCVHNGQTGWKIATERLRAIRRVFGPPGNNCPERCATRGRLYRSAMLTKASNQPSPFCLQFWNAGFQHPGVSVNWLEVNLSVVMCCFGGAELLPRFSRLALSGSPPVWCIILLFFSSKVVRSDGGSQGEIKPFSFVLFAIASFGVSGLAR